MPRSDKFQEKFANRITELEAFLYSVLPIIHVVPTPLEICESENKIRDPKVVKVVDTVEPEPELVAKYEERYQKFRKIYPTVKELF